jgi:hypothetical protein
MKYNSTDAVVWNTKKHLTSKNYDNKSLFSYIYNEPYGFLWHVSKLDTLLPLFAFWIESREK